MLRRRAMSYELVFKALEFLAILKRGGGGGRGARKSVNRKLPIADLGHADLTKEPV